MFADSFHSLDGGDYHPWVLSIFEGVRGSARLRAVLEYPLLGPFARNFGSSAKLIAKDSQNRAMATEKAFARKAQGEMPGGRRDFMTYMLRKGRDGSPGFTDLDIVMNSPILVLAGSETTATSLAGLFFHLGLAENRHIYDKLVEEILGAFAKEDDIDMKSTASLPYLRAVLEENLRLFPPAAETPPRISPGAELNGEFVPKGVSCSAHFLITDFQELIIFHLRPSYQSTSARHSAIPPTSSIQIPSGPNDGSLPRTHCTTRCLPLMITTASSLSALARETVLARTWRIRSCGWL